MKGINGVAIDKMSYDVTKTDYSLNSGKGLSSDTIRYMDAAKEERERWL